LAALSIIDADRARLLAVGERHQEIGPMLRIEPLEL
jgi:hypothetical protein